MQLERKKTPRRTTALRLATVTTVAAAAVLATATPSWASTDVASVSPSSGPSGGTNLLTLSVASPTAANAFVQGSASVIFVGASTCAASPNATYPVSPVASTFVLAANVRVLTPSKLAVTVPSGVTTSLNAGVTSVCVYASDSSGSALLAAADSLYAVGAVPTITSITPIAAPAQGGGKLTLVGTNLTSGTVTVGGVALILPTVTSTQITGTIPAHSPGGPFPVVASVTGGGSVTKPNFFTYSNGLAVAPNTSPNTKAKTDVDVVGSGFTSMTFTTTNGQTPNDNNAHVYLVKGVYDSTKNGLAKTNGQTTECQSVIVVSDSELVCSLYLAGGGVPMSTTRAVSATASGTTLTATAGNFGPGDIGMTLTGTGITAGTTIVSVIDPTKAILSKSATIANATSITLVPSRSFTDDLTFSGTTATSSSNASFVASDVGRVITGFGLPAGTTISGVTSSTVATLSQAASGSPTGNVVIGAPPLTPVPNGVYTVAVVSNGGVDVQDGGTNADPAFVKSIISSGSTFTVSDY
jgi:hypothetical protein